MSSRGRGRGKLLANPPRPPGILSVSKGRGIQYIPKPPAKSDENVGKNGDGFSQDNILYLLNVKQGDDAQAVASELLEMMAESTKGGAETCHICTDAMFSSEILSNLPTQWIVEVLSFLENKTVNDHPFRNTLFSRLEKIFLQRGSIRNVANAFEYKANMKVLSGLTKALKTPAGDVYLRLLKATLTWITEMLADESSIDTAAGELAQLESFLVKYKDVIQSPEPLLDHLYISVRRAIISGKCTKGSCKILLKSLERYLVNGKELEKDVASLYR